MEVGLHDVLMDLDMVECVDDGTTLNEIQWRLAAMGVDYPARPKFLCDALFKAGWTREIGREGRRWYQPGVKPVRNLAGRKDQIIGWILKTVAESVSIDMRDLQRRLGEVFDLSSQDAERAILQLVYAGRLNGPRQANGVRMLSLVAPKPADFGVI